LLGWAPLLPLQKTRKLRLGEAENFARVVRSKPGALLRLSMLEELVTWER
jgi:hypothetical protein